MKQLAYYSIKQKAETYTLLVKMWFEYKVYQWRIHEFKDRAATCMLSTLKMNFKLKKK